MRSKSRRAGLILLTLVLTALGVFAVYGDRWLVVDQPTKSDAIVVLEGENDRRVSRGLELLRQGYASWLVLDANTVVIFGSPNVDLARRFAASQPPQDAARIIVCPVPSQSTKGEAHDVAACLGSIGARKVLLATSDYHSRRALTVFRHELPGYEFSAASARDDHEYGHPWWKRRQWAKIFISEIAKLAWYELVDRWR